MGRRFYWYTPISYPLKLKEIVFYKQTKIIWWRELKSYKEVFHLLNTYLTRCCGVISIAAGSYFSYVAIRYIDENVIKIFVLCISILFIIVGVKYLLESKKSSNNLINRLWNGTFFCWYVWQCQVEKTYPLPLFSGT